MKTIYLIGGAFGATKGLLLSYVTGTSFRSLRVGYLKKQSWVQHIHKVSKALSPDLEFVPEEAFNKAKEEYGSDFLFYEFGGQQYGFTKSALAKELQAHSNVFVVCRVPYLYEHVRAHFPHDVRIVRAWIYHPKKLLRQELTRFFPKKIADVKWRMERYAQAWREFLSDPCGYETLWYNGHTEHFQKQVDELLQRCGRHRQEEIQMATGECYRLPEELRAHRDVIAKKARQLDFQKSIFVMIRFGKQTEQLREKIRRVINDAGFTAVFANDPEREFSRKTLNPVLVSCLCKYGVVIFDESYQEAKTWPFSASVVYELAYMQCMGKRCAILRHESISVADTPFDLAGEYLQQYDTLPALEAKLKVIVQTLRHNNEVENA